MPPVGFEPKISAGERLQAAHLLRSAVIVELPLATMVNQTRDDVKLRCKACQIAALSLVAQGRRQRVQDPVRINFRLPHPQQRRTG